MLPVCKYLSQKLKEEVELIEKQIFDIEPNIIFKNSKNRILFLENIRFYKQEEKNNEGFAKLLSSFGDIYINEAFSCSHRAHASIDKITKFIPSYCGIQMDNEVNALKKVTSDIKRPITCIIWRIKNFNKNKSNKKLNSTI
jgi:3-phosphoglycerate kinase